MSELVCETAKAGVALFSKLSRRRDTKSAEGVLEEFLAGVGRLYAASGYLPQASPGHARNFTYWRVLGDPGEEAEVLVGAVSGILGRGDLNVNNPGDVAASLLFSMAYTCTTIYTGGGVEACAFEADVAGRRVGLNAVCEALGPGLHMFLTFADHKYLFYTSDFLVSVLLDFLKRTGTKRCSDCKAWTSRLVSVRDAIRFYEECPACWEAFREELTSRISPGLRAALISLQLYKWVYSPAQLLEGAVSGFSNIRPRGLRAIYTLAPTYLGRLVSEAVETWRYIIAGEEDIKGLGNIIVEYFHLFPKVREEVSGILRGSSGRSWANLHRDIESIGEFLKQLDEIQRASPALRKLGVIRTGEIIDDIVGYVINETVYRMTSRSVNPALEAFYKYFEGIDLEAILYKRMVRRAT